jgi:2-succinyl-6-hydroxy-2,4-cyclohexadiene-1-carboxylate synthase
MKSITVNNVRYAYKIHQQDEGLPYLLMLHGFMGDHRVFDHLVDKLCSFCNPIALDLLGFGQSSKPDDHQRYFTQNQVQDLKQLMQVLELESVFLFGYSMGGRLALQAAVTSSEYFAGLILESTTCGIADPQKRKARRHTDDKRAYQIEHDFEEFLARWKKLELFQSPLPTNKSLIQRYSIIQAEQSPQALAASLRGFGTGSMHPACEKLNQLELPTLLLAGSADPKYQRINRYLAEQLPNTTFSSIKAGHRTHVDNPTAFITEIKQYVNKNFQLTT